MKTMKNVLLLAASAVFIAACGDLTEIPDVEPSGKGEPVPDEVFTLSGEVSFAATLADLADGTSQLWKAGDAISVSDGKKVWKEENEDDAQVWKFVAEVSDGTAEVLSWYPYASDVVIDGSVVEASIPVEQTVGGVPAPMVAKSSSPVLFFNNLAARLCFSLDMDGVKEVELEASSPVAGAVRVDFSGDVPVMTASASTVKLHGDFKKGETYWFTLAPGMVDELSLTFSSETADIAHADVSNVELKAGASYSLGTVIEDVPTYQVSHVWIYGGTGPEYGGGKLYDLLEKEDYFNGEDGRGIGAIKDNYYELHHDGTFYNWAGEDARNWWMVFSGSKNPTNGKDIDLHSFYDLIPRHQARYELSDSGEIKFIWSNDNVTGGRVVGPGKCRLSEYGHEVDVKALAIRFDLSVGHDDWNNMYNEYNAIACRPRVMLVELTPMETTFHTPEESKTIDEAFEYVAPLEPEEKFDFETFPGSWNVRGGNNSPYGIWVLGGTGDDPAFISPIDKSWDWDDSIWKESDNGLVIEVTEKTDKLIKGTSNYWCGADGQFWNYKWNGTDDLSHFYGLLPHGKYEFSIDLETFEVTFSNGAKATLLGPGTHEFIHGRTLDIPDGMFAFDFAIGTEDMETPTSQRWTDIDRFVYGPRNYVMIFEKE